MSGMVEVNQIDYLNNIFPFWDLLKDIIILVDGKGAIVFVNKEYLGLVDMSLEEMQQSSLNWCNSDWESVKTTIDQNPENIIFFELNECNSTEHISLQFVQKLIFGEATYYLFQENRRSFDGHISRALLNNKEVGFISINSEREIENFNKTAQRMVKQFCNKEFFSGDNFFEFIRNLPEWQIFEKYCTEALNGEYVFYSQNYTQDSGLDSWCEFQFNPITKVSGQVSGVAIMIRDISDYKNSEFETRRNETIFRNTFNNINDPSLLWQKKADGFIVLENYNNSAEEISRGNIKEWVGSTIEQFFPGLDHIQKIFYEVFESGDKRSEEIFTRMITTGEDKWFSSDYIRISSDFLLNISKDITARKQADLALAEKQRQYETLLKNLPGMAYRCKNDEDWTMEFVSAGCVELTGYAPEELVGNAVTSYEALIHREDAQLVKEMINEGLKIQHGFELIYRIFTKSGEIKWVWERGQAIENERGEIFALEGFISDITERIQSEQKAEKARRQAEALQEAMAELASQLDLSQVLRRILLTLKKVLEYDSATLFLKVDDSIKVVAARGFTNTSRLINKTFPANNLLLAEIQSTRKAIILDDAQAEPNFVRWEGADQVHGWMCVPLIRHDQFLGFLTIDSYERGKYNSEDAIIAQTFADETAIVIENARLYEHANQLATSDGLTGINNRRYFYEIAKSEFERCLRYKSPLSIIMIDIDHFKFINDNYGHAAGDQVLIQFVERVKRELRSTDILARYGGEEFIILLPETDIEEGTRVAERLRSITSQKPFDIKSAQPYITISLGVATVESDVSLLDVLIDRSDKALYESKQFGRDRVRQWRRMIR